MGFTNPNTQEDYRGSYYADRRRADAPAGLSVRAIARMVRVDPSWVSGRKRILFGLTADPEKSEAGKRGNTARQKGKAAAAEAEPAPPVHPCG